MQRAIILLASAVALILASPARADVYKFTDRSGRVFYTDRPAHSGYRLLVKSFSGVTTTYHEMSKNKAQYEPVISAAASRYGLDASLLHAVIRTESAYNPGAVSPKGAVGLMQLMPGTANRYGVADRRNPSENVDGGAHYLRDLLDLFRNTRLAVAAYNSGEGAVIKHGRRIPPFPETQQYVSRVMGFYGRL
jgi:soluble lytic murein transglycosylase-like protein